MGKDSTGHLTFIDQQNVCAYGNAKATAKEYEKDGYTCDLEK